MNFFGWVILLDAMAIVTIATLIVRLSTSRPADENRVEMARVVHEVLHGIPDLAGGFRPRRTRTLMSASSAHVGSHRPSTPGLAGTVRTSLRGLVRSSRVVMSRFVGNRSAET